MIRLSLRQFRLQGLVAIGLLVIAAALLGATGPHLVDLYHAYLKAEAACTNVNRCSASFSISKTDGLLELIGTALVALPGLIGAFWGAPLITREFENGTHRLAWTQSVSRTRWLAVKLGLVGLASVATTGLLSLMVTWWSSPIDSSNSNRFASGLFGERNVVPLGYAAFGFVLGVTLGILIRRTLPAMAATLGLYLGVRLAFTYLIRPHLISPLHKTEPLAAVVHGFGQSNGGPPELFASVDLPNAWIYSVRLVDANGHGLSSHTTLTACPDLLTPQFSPPSGSGGVVRAVPDGNVRDGLQACVTKLAGTYHGVITYQPASRYWPFQWAETGVFTAIAAALAVGCFYWIRHRAS